jgi:hypothetical protein
VYQGPPPPGTGRSEIAGPPGTGRSEIAGPAPAPPPRETWRRPVRFEPVPGSGYRLAIVGAPPAVAGPAVGSLVAGIAAVLVATLVGCLGLSGAGTGWGLFASGAFAVLAICLGVAGVGLGLVGMRQTRRQPGPRVDGVPAGRGLAVAGLTCGGVGLAITVCGLGAAAAIQLT